VSRRRKRSRRLKFPHAPDRGGRRSTRPLRRATHPATGPRSDGPPIFLGTNAGQTERGPRKKRIPIPWGLALRRRFSSRGGETARPAPGRGGARSSRTGLARAQLGTIRLRLFQGSGASGRLCASDGAPSCEQLCVTGDVLGRLCTAGRSDSDPSGGPRLNRSRVRLRRRPARRGQGEGVAHRGRQAGPPTAISSGGAAAAPAGVRGSHCGSHCRQRWRSSPGHLECDRAEARHVRSIYRRRQGFRIISERAC
jgi:hypothetical protein